VIRLILLAAVALWAIPILKPVVIQSYPHDSKAFTQGLIVKDGFFWEGTGLIERSSLRKVEIKSGKVLLQQNLKGSVFGEGLTFLGGRFYQLSWKNGEIFEWDEKGTNILKTHKNPLEGWGITVWKNQLILSDGSSMLWRWTPGLPPSPFQEVVADGKKISQINELETVKEYILANVWQMDHIAVIDPKSGQVVEWWDCSLLKSKLGNALSADVLNGIAYDAQKKKIYVTGKLWDKVFEIQVKNSIIHR
jgi:glutamine cyclotransferase